MSEYEFKIDNPGWADSVVFHAGKDVADQPALLELRKDGRIFWKGREVESDAELREAVIAVSNYLTAAQAYWLTPRPEASGSTAPPAPART